MLFTILVVLFVIDMVLLILVVMLQVGGGAEAGLMSGSLSPFGSRTSDVMVKITGWLGAIFLVLALLLAYIRVRERREIVNISPPEVAPATTPTQTNQPASTGQSTNF